jgi:threonine/homoserine/homoserine lactone efflux protein
VPFSSFVLATLALNLAPGPDMTYVAARSLGLGRRAGLISALGISVGCVFHVAMAAAGVAVVLRAWPQAYAVVRMIGAAYLLYLGLGLIRHARDRDALTATAPDSNAAIFRQGVVTNVLNPKVALFFLAFLPQFVDPARGSVALQTMGLGAWFITSGTLVNAAVAWLAASVRSLLESRAGRAWFQRTSGAILIGLGVRLALVRSN